MSGESGSKVITEGFRERVEGRSWNSRPLNVKDRLINQESNGHRHREMGRLVAYPRLHWPVRFRSGTRLGYHRSYHRAPSSRTLQIRAFVCERKEARRPPKLLALERAYGRRRCCNCANRKRQRSRAVTSLKISFVKRTRSQKVYG